MQAATPSKAQAEVIGEVCYREGDGPLIAVPRGPIAVETAGQDAILSWTDGEVNGNAALPLADYQRYVKEGAIRLRG